ncbi:MAG TPA: ATP-binding protein, partial [Myxococcaceae bacterium]|nr:ATP-binding protein [Myxococcaceae bacterium]
YHVEAAGSFAEALEPARRGFEVALVDVKLPDGDGTELAGRLKALCPDGEVILLTGFATIETAAQAVRAGASAYLVKPCATPELLLSIEQAMRKVRLQVERRELERRAQVSEKLAAVGTLTAGLSHEIRNPLNAAALQLSVLERRVHRLGRAQQGELLEPLFLVRDEIRRLEHILQDFLQFARPTQFRPVPVAVGPLIERVASLMSEEASSRGVRIDVGSGALPRVAGHEERLRQVLINLVLNGLHASPQGGVVRVAAEAVDHQVRITVDDAGPGIPEAVQPRLFEPFFTTKPEGSGLGLAIVHTIVTQHGGTISAGAAPGGGARFILTLPVAREDGR